MNLVGIAEVIPFRRRSRDQSFNRREPGPAVTWTWAGELDAADVAALRVTWRTLLADDPSCVVLDMARGSFIDCGVLSFLVAARREARDLVLTPVSLPVRRFLHLAHQDGLLSLSEPDPGNPRTREKCT